MKKQKTVRVDQFKNIYYNAFLYGNDESVKRIYNTIYPTILPKLRKETKRGIYRQRDLLKSLIQNLLISYKYNNRIIISRSKDDFNNENKKYKNVLFLQFDRCINMLDALIEYGYINQQLGDRKTKMLTTISSTKLFNDLVVTPTNDIEYNIYLDKQTKILLTTKIKKDGKIRKKLVDYTPTRLTRSNTRTLHQLDSFIKAEYNGHPLISNLIMSYCNAETKLGKQFRLGGRIYCNSASWQGMNS
jgi:hypothetical protein